MESVMPPLVHGRSLQHLKGDIFGGLTAAVEAVRKEDAAAP